MLSLTCKASIKAVIYLGSVSDIGKKTSIKDIATYINENEHTVGKLLQKLVKGNIIHSTKGPNGGFYITDDQKNQPMINIIRTIDGKDIFNSCGLGLSKCNASHPCPIHDDFKPIRENFEKMCSEKKISDLYENVNKGLAYLIG